MTDEEPDSDAADLEDAPVPEDATPPGAAAAPGDVEAVWDDVIADMEATAAELRDDGWTVAEVHPGDVAVPKGGDGGRWGIDIVVPDNEFEDVQDVVRTGDLTESQVYRGDVEGLVLLVVAMRDADEQEAVVFPAYFDVAQASEMLDRARDEGEMQTHLRPLDERAIVTFRHDDVGLFLPDE